MSSDVISRIKASFSRAAAFLCRKLRPAAAPSEDGSSADAHKEIRSTIELQATEGAVTPHDAEMLGGVLDLSELQVLDIMVHRTKMATIDISEPVDFSRVLFGSSTVRSRRWCGGRPRAGW